MEQSPQSLSVFLNSFSSKPDGRIEGSHSFPSDMVLPYISQMLMEDDIDDTLSDHPALLQGRPARICCKMAVVMKGHSTWLYPRVHMQWGVLGGHERGPYALAQSQWFRKG
jgi:hypothetical protein